MNKLAYISGALLFSLCSLFSSCSDFEPKGCPDLPELATASDLKADVNGRTVSLSWQLPADQLANISEVRVLRDSETLSVLPANATSCVLKSQPMERDIIYTVKIAYKDGYVSEGTSVKTVIPLVVTKMAYLLLDNSVADIADDDEKAAAEWFAKQENAIFIHADELASLNPEEVSVVWIQVDRVGLPLGWEQLPAPLPAQSTIDALRKYSSEGGSLYLSNMATQLTLPLGFVPDGMAPTLFGSGEGGDGTDVWCINQHLGWDFRNGADQGYYDRTSHEIFRGLTMEDPNGYGYDCLPLIGPGRREDHNCMWDCNIYGKGDQRDVIANFEVTTNSLVLATWGHVRDHCVAGLVAFNAAGNHGRCVANGFAAYEWNQNSGVNIYQKNVETLTLNILNYLK